MSHRWNFLKGEVRPQTQLMIDFSVFCASAIKLCLGPKRIYLIMLILWA